ncbi:MAG: hypothetical protein Kow0063_02310 [Anaerolineae bacterium]
MRRPLLWTLVPLLAAILLGQAGCNFSPVTEPTGVNVGLSGGAATLTPSVTATAPFLEVLAITPAATPTPITPSATPTITDTPGPFEHVVQEGDQLIAIVQEYGHFDLAVLDVIVTMNANIPNADRLPPPGSVILIPRPTPSPTPPGGELTATLIARNPPTATPELLTMTHVVQEGQTIVGIALQYGVPIYILANLNPRLDWRGCDFNIPGGGPDCGPPLSIGQELIVPAPTPTPTLSPTPSGSETPTPSPTYGPVRLLAPASGVIIMGGPLILRWVSAGVLSPDELYQVTVTDHTTGTVYTEFTRENTLTLPGDLQPLSGETRDMSWGVVVVRVRQDNVAEVVGALGEERPFRWVGP